MSDDTKKKEQITLPTWDQLVQWNHYHAVSLDNASLNPKGVLGYSYEVKVGTTGSLYTRKGGLLIPASSATVANLMDPTIVANGRVIRTSEPVVDGLIAGARTYGGNKKGDKLLDMALESSLGKDEQRNKAVDLCLGTLNDSTSIFYKDVESEGGTIKSVPMRYHFYQLPPNKFATNARFNSKSTEEINEDLNNKLVFLNDLASREYRELVQDLADKTPDENSTDFIGKNNAEKVQAYLPVAKQLLKSIMQVNVAYFMSVEFEVEGEQRKGLDVALTRTLSLDKLLDATLNLRVDPPATGEEETSVPQSDRVPKSNKPDPDEENQEAEELERERAMQEAADKAESDLRRAHEEELEKERAKQEAAEQEAAKAKAERRRALEEQLKSLDSLGNDLKNATAPFSKSTDKKPSASKAAKKSATKKKRAVKAKVKKNAPRTTQNVTDEDSSLEGVDMSMGLGEGFIGDIDMNQEQSNNKAKGGRHKWRKIDDHLDSSNNNDSSINK